MRVKHILCLLSEIMDHLQSDEFSFVYRISSIIVKKFSLRRVGSNIYDEKFLIEKE